MTRASHLILDDDPKVFADPLALDFSGMQDDAELLAALDRIGAEVAKASTPEFAATLLKFNRANIILRQRYAEDELESAIAGGTRQYVILGAGLDSFAYRRPEMASDIRVFEVDYPATQQWKIALLEKLGMDLPDNLTFVPVDFEKQNLADALAAAGLLSGPPTFFSWLGVSMYLTEDAVLDTLRYVASLGPGSEIVFQYYLSESLLSNEDRLLLAAYETATAKRGEPWVSFFDPADLAEKVTALGFARITDLGPDQANARYFAGRMDGLYDAGLSHHMKARV